MILDDPMTITCRRCGAEAGVPCMRMGGFEKANLFPTIHAVRWSDATVLTEMNKLRKKNG